MSDPSNPGRGGPNARRQAFGSWPLRLALGALALVVIGCSTASGEGITAEPTATASGLVFPKQAPVSGPQTYPAALLKGQLVVAGRCLRLIAADGGASYMLVWPPDFNLSTDRGTFVVLDLAGQVRYRAGETVALGGGEAPADETSWLNTPLLHQKPPKECPGPYWLVSPAP